MSRLTDKKYKSYQKLSRYAVFPFYYDKVNEKYVYGTTSYLKENTNYSMHLVTQEDTWDSLALEYYNNPTYFWILCNFNKWQDPFKDPEIGTYIKIPTFSEIEFK